MRRHTEAILAECRLRARGLRPATVFLGGGTPSLLSPEILADFLRGLQEISGFRDRSTEVTMEANPESLDSATARAAFEGGVTRLSIGVQSLRNEVLRAYDRAHDRETALEAFRIARESGFQRINLDLIFAFPGQDLSAWKADLREILDLGPEHLSCYELSFEPGTALSRMRDHGRIQAESAELRLELFRTTKEMCAASGLQRYEVSNFARTGEECRHNLHYWRNENYLGIGAGAWSWMDGVRRRNCLDPNRYQERIEAGRDPTDITERPSPQTVLFDCFMMGLRLEREGVDCRRVERISGLDPFDSCGETLSALLDEGLLLRESSRLRASERGFLLLDSVLERLLPEEPTLRV